MLLRYPDGPIGLALLLLRLSATLIVCPVFYLVAGTRLEWWAAASLSAMLVIALLAGIGTRPVSALLLFMLVARIYVATGESQLLLLASAGSLGALMLLGPGAYSLDAQRFGRRVIRLDGRSPDKGTTE